jgi:hypothetical protein
MKEYDGIRQWHDESTLETIRGRLEKRDFTAHVLKTPEEVTRFVLENIPSGASVGIGGSVTVRELGIDRALKERGQSMFDHWDDALPPEQKLAARKGQLTCDVFLTGVNALTLDGRIVNIDGIGNRVAAAIYGPGHVIAFAGINKVVRDLDEALWRIKNTASPRNSRRLGLKTPCAAAGHCTDCKAPTSVCRVTTITEYRPSLTPFTVILMPFPAGF